MRDSPFSLVRMCNISFRPFMNIRACFLYSYNNNIIIDYLYIDNSSIVISKMINIARDIFYAAFSAKDYVKFCI